MKRALAILLLFPAVALAQPSITGTTGTFDHGESYTIAGTSFGVKGQAAPVLWDDFEGGSNGAAIGAPTIGGNWSRTNSSTYTNSDPYAGSLCSYKAWPDGSQIGLARHWIPDVVDRGFMHMKAYYTHTQGYCTGSNVKYIRLNSADGDLYTGAPNILIGHDRNASYFAVQTNTGGACWQGCQAWLSSTNILGSAWYTAEVWVVRGTYETEDGRAGRRVNANFWEDASWETNCGCDTYSGYRNAYFFPYMSSEGVYSGTIKLDNCYADTTLARVCIGNSNDFTSMDDVAMQIPTAWSATSITVTVNTENYSTDDGVYLYVVDRDGDYSAGYYLTIGATGDPGPSGIVPCDSVWVDPGGG